MLALSDGSNLLSFVTLSLDCVARIWGSEGELEGETPCDGQAITGLSVPGKRDYFLVSTVNEETAENRVALYRKAKLVTRLTTPFPEAVLDLKVSSGHLFVPRGLNSIDRLTVPGL